MGEPQAMALEHASGVERLLEDSWEARDRRASHRELIVESVAGVLFALAATALLWLSGAAGSLHVLPAALLVAAYAAVARIEFPIGAGHVIPTQLVLVPMLMVLPPGAVPALAAAGLLAPALVDWRLGRIPARRIVSTVPDAWHAIGPALVLVLAGRRIVDFDDAWLMGLAFVACCLTDLVSSIVRMRLTGVLPEMRLHLRVIAMVWTVDACLAPLGFVAALATHDRPVAVLGVLPLAGLLWLLARDRHERIEQAHTRLKVAQHERTRMQSALRRLGEAFAAKLELDGLLDILLRASVEALDAAGGELVLRGPDEARRLEAGAQRQLVAAQQRLMLPLEIRVPEHELVGELRLARDGRAFEDDERALIRELVAKAELAAAEILTHQLLQGQVVTDALTDLGNRRKLSADLDEALDRAAPSLLLLFDLDGFKTYNDTFGHLAGDALLSRLGVRFRAAVEPAGEAYRLGGDEFCALLDVEGRDVDALIAAAAEALSESGGQFSVRASLGAVLLPHEADNPDQALQLADQRMYANKRSRPAGPRDQARDVLMRTMQAKQPDLDEHSSGVADLAVRVGRALGLSGESLDEIARAAELHDVGKVGIPDAILNKPGRLDDGEWDYMLQHTILGERILNAAPALRPVARLVRASHERWDGKGYPDRLAGEQIPLGARIVAVCDAYEAMTADRPYRAAMAHPVACAELRHCAGGQFDPSVVEAFLATIGGDVPAIEPSERASAIDDAVDHIRALLRP